MSISTSNSIQPTTIPPKELLERFKKGETPDIENYKDKMTNELDALAEQYKQSMSVDIKRNILDKEREILFEELKHPELTLARNYGEIVMASLSDNSVRSDELDDLLRLMNITALQREAGVQEKQRGLKISEKHIDILKDVYMASGEDNNTGLKVRSFITGLLSSYKENYPELSDKISKTYDYLYEHSTHPDLKDNIKSYNEDYTVDYCLEQLEKKDSNYEYFLNKAMNDADRKDTRVSKLVNELLKSEDLSPNIKRQAILGGGKFRSNENFEILKEIALNTKEPDIRKREFAIQSAALYIKDKPDEVKDIMSSISKEDSIFAPLGKILSDKITGNYYNQADRELNYAGLGPKVRKDFKARFKKFYLTDGKLSPRKINSLQENTIPFSNHLDTLVKGTKYLIISDKDTITRHLPDYTGNRYIFPGAIMNSGPFFDSYDGLNTSEYNLMSRSRIADSLHQNQVAHETAHSLHSMFSDECNDLIEELYQTAKKENRTLDYYADANSHEYFAQGCDAFASHYKPHKLLMLDAPLGHTIYELMDKDPALYNFIKTILKK